MGLAFTHIFSSHLQRAAKTAELIREPQTAPATDDEHERPVPDIVQLPVLMEQDFGHYEGKKWNERLADSRSASKEAHHQSYEDTEGFVDVESKDSLTRRADTFLDRHVLPLMHELSTSNEYVVAVVSHGIMLSALWKRLLLRLPSRSVTLSPELAATTPISLEHLGGWSNTGYLELHMARAAPVPTRTLTPPASVPYASEYDRTLLADGVYTHKSAELTAADVTTANRSVPSLNAQKCMTAYPPTVPQIAHGWMTVIRTVNGREHLKSLKRTRGGVGSSRYDASQKNIESFFKRQKVD